MPTPKMHLAIAKKVNETLNMDLDSIMIGSILPDKYKNHIISHYQNGKPGAAGTANADLFLKENQNRLDNPIIIGYLTHLLADKYFNTYMFNKYYIYDEEGNEVGLHMKSGDKHMSKKEIKDVKHSDFFTYDEYLLTHDYISKFKSAKCLDNIPSINNCKFEKKELKEFIKITNDDIDKVTLFRKIRSNFFSYKLVNKKDLDSEFNKCVKYIIEYINTNNKKKNKSKSF